MDWGSWWVLPAWVAAGWGLFLLGALGFQKLLAGIDGHYFVRFAYFVLVLGGLQILAWLPLMLLLTR